MPAIWHEHGLPSFLGVPPSFSFWDQAEAVIVIPEHYTSPYYVKALREWREPWRHKMHVECVALADIAWQVKRPWYCSVI